MMNRFRDTLSKYTNKATLKPLHLFDAELLHQSEIDAISASIPRIMICYAHLNEHQVEETIKYLQEEKEKGIKGTLTLPFIGRAV